MKFLFYIAAAVIIVLVTVNLASRTQGEQDQPETSTVPHYQIAANTRIWITDEAHVSRNQDPMLVQLEIGTIPQDATNITVLTDENCQPDADGVSHCLNRIRYETAGGAGEAALRHHHRMTEEPCLTPGESLVVVN
jgi:hypothetical protein